MLYHYDDCTSKTMINNLPISHSFKIPFFIDSSLIGQFGTRYSPTLRCSLYAWSLFLKLFCFLCEGRECKFILGTGYEGFGWVGILMWKFRAGFVLRGGTLGRLNFCLFFRIRDAVLVFKMVAIQTGLPISGIPAYIWDNNTLHFCHIGIQTFPCTPKARLVIIYQH